MKRTPHTYECHITHPVPRFRSFLPDRQPVQATPRPAHNFAAQRYSESVDYSRCWQWVALFQVCKQHQTIGTSAGLASNARPSPRIHTPLQVLCNSSVHQNIDRTPEVCCTKNLYACSFMGSWRLALHQLHVVLRKRLKTLTSCLLFDHPTAPSRTWPSSR